MRLVIFALILSLCAVAAFAQGASWQPVPLKYTWDYLSSDFCPSEKQCLVNPLYNEAYNGQPALYFQKTAASELPKCINESQYILDHMCVNGSWSSRTRNIAEQLLSIVLSKGLTKYELFCDKYPASLNTYDYFEGSHLVLDSIGTCTLGVRNNDCANNFCVLTAENAVAFGVSLNKPISDSSDSFLFALGKSRTLCNNVPDSDVFSYCGEDVYYNPVLNAVIFFNASVPAASAPRSFIDGLYSDIQQYGLASGYSVFNFTPAFNQLRVGRNNNEFAFSFKQKGAGALNEQYAGWYFYNFDIPDSACDYYFKPAGNPSYVGCYPKNDSYYVVSHWNSALPSKGVTVDWSLFSGSMRVMQ
ncbi:hypothetical protein KY329_05235 [Candidatus Woesearchaeota archaeon]|nr:hypothetical protein [Candidatus Woesearchaeota archaeon]